MQQTRCVGSLNEPKSGIMHQTDKIYIIGECSNTLQASNMDKKEMFLEVKRLTDERCEKTIPSRAEQSRAEQHDSVDVLGSLYGMGTGFAGVVVSQDGIAPTLSTMQGGGRQPHILEVENMSKVICSSRGKDKDDPGFRGKSNSNFEQRLEPNATGTSNTITTVTKDNLLVETDPVKYVLVKQATKEGYIPCEIGGVADLEYPDSQTRRGRVIDQGRVSPTLTTASIPSVLEDWIWEIDGVRYLIRIRKLTSRECWRLMGFTDDDYDKAAEVNCESALYKQAGNSIVKDVLMHVFSKFINKEDNNG